MYKHICMHNIVATQRWDPHEPVHACPKYRHTVTLFLFYLRIHTCLFVHYWDATRPLDFTRWMLIHNQRGIHFRLVRGIPSSYATQWWGPHICTGFGCFDLAKGYAILVFIDMPPFHIGHTNSVYKLTSAFFPDVLAGSAEDQKSKG